MSERPLHRRARWWAGCAFCLLQLVSANASAQTGHAPAPADEPSASAAQPPDAQAPAAQPPAAGSVGDTPTKTAAGTAASPTEPLALSAVERSARYRDFVESSASEILARRKATCRAAQAEPTDDVVGRARFANVQSSATSVASGQQSATTANRLAAAFGTDVEGDGVEAGIELEPLALFDAALPNVAWTLQLAALKDSKTRVGSGVSYLFAPQPELVDTNGAVACVPNMEQEVREKVGAALVSAEVAFDKLCDEVVPFTSPGQMPILKKLCENPRKGAMGRLVKELTKQSDVATASPTDANLEFRTRIRANQESFGKLETTVTTLTTLGAGYSQEKFLNEYRRKLYEGISTRIGVDGSVDFDAWKFGCEREMVVDGNVEEEPLPDGSVLGWRVGPTVTFKQARWSVSLATRVGQTIPEADDQLRRVVAPGVEASYVLHYLDHKKGEPIKLGENGKLPPRIALGLKGAAEVALQKPDFQTSKFNEVEAMVYTDFVVSDNLSFRLGVPLQGALIEQEAGEDDAGNEVPKRTVLQWTVPVTIVTAVSL